MYSNIKKGPTNTKYTDYVQKLQDEHVRSVKQVKIPPISIAKNKATKFSDIFSPDESNALKQYFLQKATSSPNIISENGTPFSGGNDESINKVIASPVPKRRRSADFEHADPIDPVLVQGQFENKLRTSSESVANIVYSTIRPDYHETNPINIPTGSDSKQDYDPHEPLPNVDQLALRHELLNNIRHMSRATYFEDLYTGKTDHNDEPPEAEIMEILQNSSNREEQALIPDQEPADTNQRVEHWVQESVKNSIDNGDDLMEHSLFHQSVWDPPPEDPDSEFEILSEQELQGGQASPNPVAALPNNTNASKPTPLISKSTNSPKATSPELNLPRLTNSYNNNVLNPNSHRERRPYSFNESGPGQVLSTYINPNMLPVNAITNPVFSNSTAISPHLLRQTKFQHNRDSHSKPVSHHINPAAASGNFSRHMISPPLNNNEQAQRLMLRNNGLKGPPSQASTVTVRKQNNLNSLNNYSNKIPRIYQRQNMNQWVAKKVWFYMNGDERSPRMEYRFRPRDLPNMDALLNLLNKKMPKLPTGARYVFAMDGRIIHSVEELQNESSYVVSSTRKFKVR